MKLANPKDCTACMACVDACRRQVLEAVVDADGYYAIRTANPDTCVECGRCTLVCPVLHDKKPEGASHPFAAWNTHEGQRRQSASGGVFSALATVILHRGGTVYGAAIDGFEVRHLRIETEEELPLLQGSKYQHSNLAGVYRQVKTDLQKGRYVLFSGLGCQVAALLSFLGKTDHRCLYTVDTICGGLSTMLPMQWLQREGRYRSICCFRDKENGWRSMGFRYSLKMVRTDGMVEDLGLDNAVLNTFSSKLLKRSSCLDCRFTGFHRQSDCTIGDFWGDTRFPEEHPQGLSVLMVHSQRMEKLLGDADLQLRPVSWSQIYPGNHNIYWTHYPLVRLFPSRRIVLHAMRRGDFAAAMKQIRPWTAAGLALRIYFKYNSIIRKIKFRKLNLQEK